MDEVGNSERREKQEPEEKLLPWRAKVEVLGAEAGRDSHGEEQTESNAPAAHERSFSLLRLIVKEEARVRRERHDPERHDRVRSPVVDQDRINEAERDECCHAEDPPGALRGLRHDDPPEKSERVKSYELQAEKQSDFRSESRLDP